MKKRISLYLGLDTIAQLKSMSENSQPHACQSAIVADLINKAKEEKLETSIEKNNQSSSTKKTIKKEVK
jgi:hypothetical protein